MSVDQHRHNHHPRSTTKRIITATIRKRADRLKQQGHVQETPRYSTRNKLCPKELDEETPPHLRKATRRELQGDGFMKHTTPARRHRPIRGSWTFIRSVEGPREAATAPSRRERRPWTPPPHPEKNSGKGFPPANSPCPLHGAPNVDKRHTGHRHRKPHASHRATPVVRGH